MTASKEFYIVSVANGQVLSQQPTGSPSALTAQYKGDQDKQQKWTVESGDEPNVVALKCTATGQYLNTKEGNNWGRVGLGEKQWWNCDQTNVSPPAATRLSPVDHPTMFLNHFQGQRTSKGSAGITVHMWQWEQPNEFCLTWYFVDAAGGFGPHAAIGAADEAEAKAALEDMKAREVAMAQKEHNVTAKQNELESQAADNATRARELQAKLDAVAAREEDVRAKYKGLADVQDREQASAEELTKRERKLNKQEQASVKELERRERELAEREQALDARDRTVLARKDSLQADQLDTPISKAQSDGSFPAANGHSKSDSTITPESVLEQLQARLAIIEHKLAEDQQPLSSSRPVSADTKTTSIGPSSTKTTATRSPVTKSLPSRSGSIAPAKAQLPTMGQKQNANNATKMLNGKDCGHLTRHPPRKIERRVVGYIYDGDKAALTLPVPKPRQKQV